MNTSDDAVTNTARCDQALAQSRWAERTSFVREAARNWNQVGAVAPSGRALAQALTAPVADLAARPLSVLEVGAGTGSVTRALIPLLSNGSTFDIVEANPHFADGLRDLARELAPPEISVKVHAVMLQDLDTDRRYDVIVSGLPLTNFAPDEVERIMNRSLELLKPGGSLTYFAYLGSRQARAMTSSRTEARRHAAVDDLMHAYQKTFAVGRTTVWANLPPAYAWHLRPVSTPDLAARLVSRPSEVDHGADPEITSTSTSRSLCCS